jgi:hypothetical protein
MQLTARQLNRSTLARQMLIDRHPISIPEAIKRIVALQAQEPASPYIAMWNRIAPFDPGELDRAFAEYEIVKASLMRITLHAVHADDYTRFHQSVLYALRASRLNDRRFAETGMTVAEADALIPALIEFGREPRSKAEIEELIGDLLGGEVHPRLWWALRTYAPMTHAPFDGVWAFGRKQMFRTAPILPERIDRVDSTRALLRRYLLGFGPASRHDFGRFTMMAQVMVKEALEGMHDLVRYEGPGGVELFDVPDGDVPDEDIPAPPRLMAMWDSVLLVYDDRSRVLPDEYRKIVIRSNGDVLPTILVDGRVAGVWRHLEGAIEVTAFQPLTSDDWEGLVVEAAGLLDLLADRDDAVYRRYARWWDKLPAGEVRRLPG